MIFQLQPTKDSHDMQLADLVDWLGNGSPVPEDTLSTVQVSQLVYSGLASLNCLASFFHFVLLFHSRTLLLH